MVTQAGTIDGIGYASSKDVYDTVGYGVVTQILYYDASGAEVADRRLFFDLSDTVPVGIGAKTVNADGTFSFNVYEPGGGGYPRGYSQDTFSSAGIQIREDNYTPIFISSPSGTYEGTAGYTDSYILFNAAGPGSSGQINGAYYDMVETVYDSSGHAVENDYFNDLNAAPTQVGRQILATPNPVFTVPAAATAIAGTAEPLPGISLSDDWAGANPGSLALIISVDSGSISGYDDNGNPFTISAGKPMKFTGTLSQINSDIDELSLTSQAAGTAHISFTVYDQAGVTATAQETITVGAASSGGAATPDPVITGVTRISAAAGTPLSLNGVTFTDPWAAAHAGTLALTVTTNFGSLSDVNGNATGSGASVHAVGNVDQIDNDLAGLILTSGQTGTATVQVAIYDQAGVEATHIVGVTIHA